MMRKEYKGWGLAVNMQKTKYLCIETERERERERESLILEGNKEVETCKEYEYLGTTLNREGTDRK